MPPTVLQPAFNAVSVDAKLAPAKATRNKKGKAKPLAKAGAKRRTEQTTLTQMDLEKLWICTALIRANSKQLQRSFRTQTAWDPADEEPPG